MLLNKIKAPFIGPNGLRAVWKIALALIVFFAWTVLSQTLITYLFSRLFTAWGVNSLNLHLAPGWVRAITAAFPYATSLLVNVPAALIMTALSREKSPLRIIDAAFFPIGVLAIAIPTLIFLLADSLRTSIPALTFHWAVIANIPIFLAAAWTEQSLCRTLLPAFIPNAPKIGKYALSAAAFFLVTRAWETGLVGAVNLTLLSVTLSALAEKRSTPAAILTRAGIMWAASSLFGMTSSDIPLVNLYPISEKLLTGGNGGVLCGLTATVALLLTISIPPIIQNRKKNSASA